jgi:hypothetical protein
MAMNINSKKPKGNKVEGFGVSAPGDAANTGTPVTPSPTKKYIAPDLISAPRAPISGGGYGQSGGVGLNNPSSIPPGTRLTSKLGEVLAEASDDGEGVLEKIIAGQGHGDNEQDATADLRRKIDITPFPSVHGQTSRQANSGSPGGTIPAKIGALDADFVARRDAALKNAG